MTNKTELKQKIEQRNEDFKKLDTIILTIESDSNLKALLNEAETKMISDMNYFRDSIDNSVNEIYSDGIVNSSEIGDLGRIENHIYTNVSILANYFSRLQSSGIAIPPTMQSNYDFLYRKMLEAKANTNQARMDIGDNNSYNSLNLSYEGVHPVQNRTAQKRISIRATPEAQKLLKELGVYREVSKETLATKRFRDVEYGRTS